jgi:hypothetical protein
LTPSFLDDRGTFARMCERLYTIVKKIAFVFALSASIALNLVAPLASHAATSTPTPSVQQLNERMRQDIKNPSPANDNPDMSSMPKPEYPAQALHVAYIVATNKRGQVVKVVAGTPCKDDRVNTYTYGNAMQMFIHRADGGADAGLFRITYDYSPTTHRIRRDVVLEKLGGVDPNAPGAIDAMNHGPSTHATDQSTHK